MREPPFRVGLFTIWSSIPKQITRFPLYIFENSAQDWDAEDIVDSVAAMLRRASSLTQLDLKVEELSELTFLLQAYG